MKEKISIGLLGMGVVGGGVAKILEEKQNAKKKFQPLLK